MYLSMVIIDLSIDIDNLYPFTAVKLKLKENVEMYVNINFYTLTIENTPCRPDHWLPCSSPHICSNKSAIWCNTQPWFVWTQDVSAGGYCVDNAAVGTLNTSQYSPQQHTLPDGGEVSSSLPPPPTSSVFSGGGNVVTETWDKHTLGSGVIISLPGSHPATIGVRRGRTTAKQQQGTRSYFGGEKQKWQQKEKLIHRQQIHTFVMFVSQTEP